MRNWVVILFFQSGISLFAQSTGIVIDTIKCQLDPNQSYALYLPKRYMPSQQWPVIFFYEPAARGTLPLQNYRILAERYQFILVCSNNSRNGSIYLTDDAEAAVWEDVNSRFSVDPAQRFISGFSGGARASVHLAVQRKGYAGIIACGASFMTDGNLVAGDSIPFIEIVGNRDMNFEEAFDTKQYLEKINYPHHLLLFEGTHAWPDASLYDQAIFWQLSHAKHFNSLHDSIRRNYDDELQTVVQQQIDSGDIYLAYLNLSQGIAISKTNSSALQSLQTKVAGNPGLEKQRIELYKLLKREMEERLGFSRMFSRLTDGLTDSVYKEPEWKSYLARINKVIRSDSRQERLMGIRIRDLILRLCYTALRVQFQSKDYLHANLTARLLALVENNAQAHFTLARSYAARGMKRPALIALKKSVDLGFKDKMRIEHDPLLAILKEEKRYTEIMNSIKN